MIQQLTNTIITPFPIHEYSQAMEGAGFAFDTADMDFNNVFATMPQQQQSFAKPTEDNTFGFFGDEGIDTAASFIDPTLFSTPSQDMSFMPQTLVGAIHSTTEGKMKVLTASRPWITL